MGLENLKFWHWMIIGVLVGVGFGYVKSQMTDVSGPTVRSWDRGQFHEALGERGTTLAVRKLVLHPANDGQEWVSGEIYQRKEGPFSIYNPNARRGNFRWRNATSQPANTQKIELPPGGRWVPLDLLAADPNRKDPYYRPDANNPVYKTMLDGHEWLAQLQKDYPPIPGFERDLTFRFAWWEVPKNMMMIYGAGGFVVIGVIWPSIIALLMGAGLAKRPEKTYDLNRFKGGEEKKEAKAGATQADQDQLAELNAKLEAGVADMLQGETTPDIDHDAEHAAVVKKLETTAMDAKEGAVAAPEKPKDYQGEFYPVAKSQGQKDEKH